MIMSRFVLVYSLLRCVVDRVFGPTTFMMDFDSNFMRVAADLPENPPGFRLPWRHLLRARQRHRAASGRAGSSQDHAYRHRIGPDLHGADSSLRAARQL